MKKKRKRRRISKDRDSHVRDWHAQYATTVQRQGQEARSGYGRPRLIWDQQSPEEREQRAIERNQGL